jgi:hypothetical protein
MKALEKLEWPADSFHHLIMHQTSRMTLKISILTLGIKIPAVQIQNTNIFLLVVGLVHVLVNPLLGCKEF